MLNCIAVFLGGGLGSICRYGFGEFFSSEKFPVGTLLANVLACFLLGYLSGFLLKNDLSDEWKLFLGTGFCGGFSTFSTFGKETLLLGQDGQQWIALFYLILSLVLGILAVYFGLIWGNSKSNF